jgi:hypothetical protein
VQLRSKPASAKAQTRKFSLGREKEPPSWGPVKLEPRIRYGRGSLNSLHSQQRLYDLETWKNGLGFAGLLGWIIGLDGTAAEGMEERIRYVKEFGDLLTSM